MQGEDGLKALKDSQCEKDSGPEEVLEKLAETALVCAGVAAGVVAGVAAVKVPNKCESH